MNESFIMATGYSPSERFSFMHTPVMQWMSEEGFANNMGIPLSDKKQFYTQYHTIKNLYYAQRLTQVQGQNFDMPLTFTTTDEATKIWNNRSAWKKLDDMTSGRASGHLVAFDTETIGDFVGRTTEFTTAAEQRAMDVAGITEIGIASKSYGRSRALKDPQASFFFGIDNEQKKWLEDTLQKKVRGESLTGTEISALERASRYSTIEHKGSVFSSFESKWNGQDYTFVKSLNVSNPDSIKDIQSGIETLAREYERHSDRDARISSVFNRINALGANEQNVLTGYNLNYDLEVSRVYGQKHGTIAIADTSYADPMLAERAYAKANNTTVAELRKTYNPNLTNNRVGSLEASEEMITGITDYAKVAHNAFEDSGVSIRTTEHDLGVAMDVINGMHGDLTTLTRDSDQLVKINKRGLIRSNDFLIVDGKPTTSYSVANQYWNFMGIGNTYFDKFDVNVGGETKTLKGSADKLVAHLQLATDENVNLIKTFDSIEDMTAFFSQNTSVVSRDSVNITLQNTIHDKDIARRVIDGFFDPKTEGYQNFNRYYSMYKDLAGMSEETVSSLGLVTRDGRSISTTYDLLRNMRDRDVATGIVAYADENNIESITSFFRRPTAPNFTAQEAVIDRFGQLSTIDEVFKVFENNEEFFGFVDQNVGSVSTGNLQKTIAFKGLRDDYLKFGNIGTSSVPFAPTLEDLTSVAIKTGRNDYTLIDMASSDAASRLQRAFVQKGQKDIVTTNGLISALDDLVSREIISPDRQAELITRYGSGQQSFYLAEAIVSDLSPAKIKEKFGEINASNPHLKQLTTGKTTLDSATSEMSTVLGDVFAEKGPLSETFLKSANQRLSQMERTFVISGALDDANKAQTEMVKSILSEMNYDSEDIGHFMSIFYRGGSGESNIAKFNREAAARGGKQIKPIFFRNGQKDSSAFLFLTTDSQYAEALSQFSNLDPNASESMVKDALKGYGSYFEIPYLQKINIGLDKDEAFRTLLGHDPTVTLVKQGDSYLKYSDMRLNLYAKEVSGGAKVWHGRIQNSGGEILTNIRPRAKFGFQQVSDENFDAGTRLLNSVNQSEMADSAAPIFSGNIKGKRVHNLTQKDLDQAFMLKLQPGNEVNQGIGMLELMEDFTVTASDPKNKGQNALIALFESFGEKFELVGNKYKRNQRTVERVLSSEQFKQFYHEYLTDQTGGIGANSFIQEIMSGTSPNAAALREVQDMSILQIMAEAVKDNPYADKDLQETLKLLAYDLRLDANVSETAFKKGGVLVNHSIAEMNNSRTSGQIRPTYAQRENYRPFTLDEEYFTDPEGLTKRLGIHFGDVYTSKEFVARMERAESQIGGSKTFRNIVGAVRSISDTEIQTGRQAGLQWLETSATSYGLDPDALKSVYSSLIDDISLYEGKFYMRPSLANQAFFSIGDPRTMRSDRLRTVFQIGTEAEQKESASILNSLIGQKVSNGTVIGKRITDNGKWANILYNGPTINEFTKQNALDLMQKGKTEVIVEKQLEDVKLMIGEEKGTVRSLMYFSSLNPEEQAVQVQEAMKKLGLGQYTTDSMSENVALLNKYTDAAFDAFDRQDLIRKGSKYRTTVLYNNNINKHLTDVAFESRWDIIANEFLGEEGFGELQSIINQMRIEDGSLFTDHLSLGATGEILFDNPTDTGAINSLNNLVQRLEQSPNSQRAQRALKELSIFEESGTIAVQPIQRQQMTTFQGTSFSLDVRAYQTLSMQIEDANYTKGWSNYGKRYAEILRRKIETGYYDKSLKRSNPVWADIVRSRRGILEPKHEKELLAGINEALDFIGTGAQSSYVSSRNMMTLNARELLANIPTGGTNSEGFKNFIFKVDGELTPFLKSHAKRGLNNAELAANSSSFYLDFSDIGTFDFEGKKVSGIVLPFQQINTMNDDIFVSGNATKATVKFLNTLEQQQTNPDKKRIEEALSDLFKAYRKEMDSYDKDSLLNAVSLKLKTPNSSQLLASDAMVPTLNIDPALLEEYRNLQREIATSAGSMDGVFGSVQKINRLNEIYEQIYGKKVAGHNARVGGLINEQIESILNGPNPVASLNLTGKDIYKKYITGSDETIESAVVVGKEMFRRTEMDTGHIGFQVAMDYEVSNGIRTYDSLSRLTGKKFNISHTEFYTSIYDTLEKFEGTAHQDWARKTRDALDEILVNGSKKATRDQRSFAMRRFAAAVDYHIGILSGVDKESQDFINQFLLDIYSGFEGIGDRYATEVGILGDIARYPLFNEGGILPVRIYLDDSIKGQTARFLGPQFSILQNLDFDGDTEFIRFLGNAGLLPRNDEEYVLATKRFDLMNGKNKYAFANALEDSLKSYNIGDETGFKATLLEALDPGSYNLAKENFLNSLGKNREWFETLNGDIQDLIFNHSKQIRDQYRLFDSALGSSALNPQMVKAALQARTLKEYIGNFSKPNLNIRDTMTYMLSIASPEDEQKLLALRKGLFTLEETVMGPNGDITTIGPTGILSQLEQQGIDVKHVRTAETLNESTSWRLGVTKLFENANGAEKIVAEDREEAVRSLIKGSRRVFFSGVENSDSEIAKEILSTPYETWSKMMYEQLDTLSKDEANALRGKTYISALYEMSLMDNANQGFFNTFKKATQQDTESFIKSLKDLSPKDRAKYLRNLSKRSDSSAIHERLMREVISEYGTDERLMIFGRGIQEGDILLRSSGGTRPEAFVFRGIQQAEDGKFIAVANEFNLKSRQEIFHESGPTTIAQGITIRDVNESIKQNSKKGRALDLKRLDLDYDRNINIVDVRSMTSAEKAAMAKQAASLSVANYLDELTEKSIKKDYTGLLIDFNNFTRNRGMQLKPYSNVNLNEIIGSIVGTDSKAFQQRTAMLEEYLQFGIDNRYITGSDNAKDLMRQINRNIAENPKKSVGRLIGDIDTPASRESFIINYIGDTEGIKIYDPDNWLKRDLNDIRISNEIRTDIDSRIMVRNNAINTIGSDFYKQIAGESGLQEKAFQTARAAYDTEINAFTQDVFTAIRKSASPEEELFSLFNWDNINGFTRKGFIIENANGKIIPEGFNQGLLKAKVGFGEYFGTAFEDLTQQQATQILNADVSQYAEGSLEYLAARNTKTLLSSMRNYDATIRRLDFTDAETLRTTFKALNNVESEAIREEAAEAARQAAQNITETTGKKTLTGTFKEAFSNIKLSDSAKKNLKIGGIVAGGLATAGVIGHALFSRSDHDNVEVPRSVERQIQEPDTKGLSHKTGGEYPNEPTQAHSERRRSTIAPPSIHNPLQSKHLYHDAKSGFNFKVSADSKKKLNEQAYAKIANTAGATGTTLNVNRDRSKVTNNWLQNKFAELME